MTLQSNIKANWERWVVAWKTDKATESIPLPEHPRPDFERAEWINLNGHWAFTFDEAATYISDDKDTKSNRGLMANTIEQEHIRTSKFRMQDLPTEVARAVEGLAVGEISKPFEMINSKGKNVCAIIKLKSRTESHRATITEDFQTMKDVVLAKRREQALNDWVAEKLKNTYVRMNDQYRDCEFQYKGWVK